MRTLAGKAAPDAAGQVVVGLDGVLVIAHSEKQDAAARVVRRGPRGKGPDNGHLDARPTQWTAAHTFHPPGTADAEAWVVGHLTTILHGQAIRAATEITAQADRARLRGAKREAVDACVGYLTGHLGYHTALEAGRPIATGAIGGACRHLIGDRRDITGARWGPDGAEAVLELRALQVHRQSPAENR